jgi:hypothetical protein
MIITRVVYRAFSGTLVVSGVVAVTVPAQTIFLTGALIAVVVLDVGLLTISALKPPLTL